MFLNSQSTICEVLLAEMDPQTDVTVDKRKRRTRLDRYDNDGLKSVITQQRS